MGRLLASPAEIADRSDDAGAEVPTPHTIDVDPRGQRIRRTGNPVGQRRAASGGGGRRHNVGLGAVRDSRGAKYRSGWWFANIPPSKRCELRYRRIAWDGWSILKCNGIVRAFSTSQ